MPSRYPRDAAGQKSPAAIASQVPLHHDVIAAAHDVCERYQGGVRREGGIPAVAAKMGVNVRVLYNKLAGDDDSFHKLSVTDLIRIWLVTGDLTPIEVLARLMNCVVFPVPDLTNVSDEALLDLLTKLHEQGGEWHGVLNTALQDGRIDPQERAQLRREAYEWIGAICEANSRLDGLAGG